MRKGVKIESSVVVSRLVRAGPTNVEGINMLGFTSGFSKEDRKVGQFWISAYHL